MKTIETYHTNGTVTYEPYKTIEDLYPNKEEREMIINKIIKNSGEDKESVLKMYENEINHWIVSERYLCDGIYDCTNINFIESEDEESEETFQFKKENPNWVCASAYETFTYIFLASRPKKLSKDWYKNCLHGSGFNYGSTNLLQNCPKNILILAEND